MVANTFLFDLDGTIWDSYPWYAASLQAVSEFSKREVIESLRSGGNVVRMVRNLGLSNSRFRLMCSQNISALHIYPEVGNVLRRLDQRKVPMGVVTNLPRWLVEPALNNLGLADYFRACEYAARKPSPTGLLKALARMQRKPNTTVLYVGDRPADADAAFKAGVSFAWASYGYETQQPPSVSIAIKSFSDLLRI